MKTQRFIIEIEMPDGDYIGSGIIQDDIQAEMDAEGNEGRCKVTVIEISQDNP